MGNSATVDASIEAYNAGCEAFLCGESRTSNPDNSAQWFKGWDLTAQQTALKLKANKNLIEQRNNVLDLSYGFLRWAIRIQQNKNFKLNPRENADLHALRAAASEIEEALK